MKHTLPVALCFKHAVGSRLRVSNMSNVTEPVRMVAPWRVGFAPVRGKGQLVGKRAIAANVSGV